MLGMGRKNTPPPQRPQNPKAPKGGSKGGRGTKDGEAEMTTEERERIRSAGAEWAKAHPLTEEKNRRLRALARPRTKAA